MIVKPLQSRKLRRGGDLEEKKSVDRGLLFNGYNVTRRTSRREPLRCRQSADACYIREQDVTCQILEQARHYPFRFSDPS